MSGIVAKNAGRASGIVGTGDIGADAVGLTEMEGGTDGQIITYDDAGDPVAVGPGSDGQVLTSTGAGSPPAFEAAGGGGAMVYIRSESATDEATVDFLDDFSATYDDYIVRFNNVIPATDNQQLKIRLAISDTSQSASNNYDYVVDGLDDQNADSNNYSGTGDTSIGMNRGVGSATHESLSGRVEVYGVNNTSNYTHTNQMFSFQDANDIATTATGMGVLNLTAAVTGIQFFFASGNVTSGDFHLYGVAKA